MDFRKSNRRHGSTANEVMRAGDGGAVIAGGSVLGGRVSVASEGHHPSYNGLLRGFYLFSAHSLPTLILHTWEPRE